MKQENLLLLISLLILSPVVVVFLMGSMGGVLGDGDVNIIVVGIAILCDVVIGCTAILLGAIHRLMDKQD